MRWNKLHPEIVFILTTRGFSMNKLICLAWLIAFAGLLSFSGPADAASHKGMFRHSLKGSFLSQHQFGTFHCVVKYLPSGAVINTCVHVKS
jgi:hypothetical protein